MKNLVFLIFSTLLFCSGNIIASTSDDSFSSKESCNKDLVPINTQNSSQHSVIYWVSNQSWDENNVYFTVHWHYSGPLEKPHIAYIVSIKGPFYGEIIRFQDSAIGKPSGAKDYSIKLNRPISSSESLYFQVWGSDGSNL